MLINATTLMGFKLKVLDGEIGGIKEFYFDDQNWKIHYLAAKTGNWLYGKQVLISPEALDEQVGEAEGINVNLTKKKIEEGPLLGIEQNISSHFEEAYRKFHGWPSSRHKVVSADVGAGQRPTEKAESHDLRGTKEIRGFRLHARDGEIGYISDFFIDVSTWSIRYLIVDTQNWWPGRKVLISPVWIEVIHWPERTADVNLTRSQVKASTEYNGGTRLAQGDEIQWHNRGDREVDWLKNEEKIQNGKGSTL